MNVLSFVFSATEEIPFQCPTNAIYVVKPKSCTMYTRKISSSAIKLLNDDINSSLAFLLSLLCGFS